MGSGVIFLGRLAWGPGRALEASELIPQRRMVQKKKNEFLKAIVLSVAASERAGQEYEGLSLENGQRTFKLQNRL